MDIRKTEQTITVNADNAETCAVPAVGIESNPYVAYVTPIKQPFENAPLPMTPLTEEKLSEQRAVVFIFSRRAIASSWGGLNPKEQDPPSLEEIRKPFPRFSRCLLGNDRSEVRSGSVSCPGSEQRFQVRSGGGGIRSDCRNLIKVAISRGCLGEQMSATTRHVVNKNGGLENRPQNGWEWEWMVGSGYLMAAFPILAPRGRSKVREEKRLVTCSWDLFGAGNLSGSEQPQNWQLNTSARGVERRAKPAGGRKHVQVTHFPASETDLAGNPRPTRGSKLTEESTR
jgi:hypothetical protein